MRVIKYILEWIELQLRLSREYRLERKRCNNCDHLRDLLRDERFERDKLINKLIDKDIVTQPTDDEKEENFKPINSFISNRARRANATYKTRQENLKNLEKEYQSQQEKENV